ncbi:MAG: hypothetical protein JO218_06690 [Burkholderiales bacterium]|nr:hypothetical protein [Burkholderiales bacterium]
MLFRILALVIACFLSSPSVRAAGFDCSKAAEGIEKLICADPELSRLDSDLNAVFRSKSGRLAHEYCVAQSNWIQRRDACKDRLCVKGLYETRINNISTVGKAAKDLGIAIDLCDQQNPTVFDIKTWPADPSQKIVVIANPAKDAGDDVVYDLYLLVQNGSDGKILRKAIDKKIINLSKMDEYTSDDMGSVWIDTANYAIKKGKRALGVRIVSGHSGNPTVSHESLYLFDFQDPKMPPVLNMISSVSSGATGTNEACFSSEWDRTIAIGQNATNGYFDLIVTEKSMEGTDGETMEDGNIDCASTTSSKKYTLRFDGAHYVVPPDLKR